LADCGEALRLEPNDADVMDSRAFVYLRLDRFDDAIADYNAVLKIEPKKSSSLYGRGLAKLRKSDAAGGNADIAAATAIQSDIVAVFARYGVTAPATPAAAGPAASPANLPAADCARAEAHWKSAEDIRTLPVYEDHLARFANCDFAALARARIGELKK
jgi:tetratricopeptide (TPR) repeat protein